MVGSVGTGVGDATGAWVPHAPWQSLLRPKHSRASESTLGGNRPDVQSTVVLKDRAPDQLADKTVGRLRAKGSFTHACT